MKRVAQSICGVLGGLAVATGVAADPVTAYRSSTVASPYMRVFGPSQPPYGFVRFCETRPEACAPQHSDESRFQSTPARLSELDEVNRGVNHVIAPATDAEIYGVSEYWTVPVDRGDCEDYALLKQQLLLARGWPMSALLLTVVRDEKGEGHAVLTARTVQGDFILDNKVDEVKSWNRTRYEYIMRQSYLNPMIWMTLDPREANSTLPIAGVRSAPRR